MTDNSGELRTTGFNIDLLFRELIILITAVGYNSYSCSITLVTLRGSRYRERRAGIAAGL